MNIWTRLLLLVLGILAIGLSIGSIIVTIGVITLQNPGYAETFKLLDELPTMAVITAIGVYATHISRK